MKNFFLFIVTFLFLNQSLFADINQDQKVQTSIKIVQTFAYDDNLTIPKSFKHGIKAVGIIPDVVKGGFLATYQKGTGIFSVKDEQGNWSPPLFVKFAGLGAGLQAGYQSADLVFLFRNRRSYSGLFDGTQTIDFGGDASIAGGGYSKNFLTDLPEISADVVVTGRSNGYFLGISLDGSTMSVLDQETIDYYGRMYLVKDILNGSAKKSKLTKKLQKELKKAF